MLKKTPLHDLHAELGASFTDFAGWSMPLRYTSELAEHHAVRTIAGIFDLTHMGEIELSGPEAGRALDHPIAMAYLPTGRSAPGTEVLVDIRGSKEPAQVVELPFYRRQACPPQENRS
ncbi:glycine cleavage T C-terminal barrel domain-containing protein [Streptomyces nigrescens]|uniref:GCVT N-terminal domain-containing protein n=1 Tax=Streptomyces nigrescens TaxID=1920 RepID=A0A640TV77_STRNI|nr:glycine cleavage T C-terminal barrel domain-containing protein [Streptomyces libani]WAU01164.1 hypothetical protein STRLI_007478 [Streptomyces libani subsp. libani]GFE27064.1 hypothetical protein Sliba_75170 [Streptomyces libani subsp. libani]GGV97136.1 hypothetical protein GCM10010500_41890 [Streptomyces libani subsp. libani]